MDLIHAARRTISEHRLLPRGGTVVVGVSGGPDSLTLLHILLTLAPEFDLRLHVGHLDHRIRGPDAQADADFVARISREWGLPLTVEASPVSEYAAQAGLSLEEAARIVRYDFLRRVAHAVGAARIAVAHNADDQVETILMHFLRGSGLAGLRGMAYETSLPGPADPGQGLRLIRPLLDVNRREIESYCRENGLSPRLDPSNRDTTIFRNRLRHEVIPYLEQINPNLREVLLNASRSLSDDYEYVSAETERALLAATRQEQGAFTFDRGKWQALSPALQRMTLRAAVAQLRHDLRNIDWIHIEHARRVALDKPAGAEATLPGGLHLYVDYDVFYVGSSPPLPDLPLLTEGTLPVAIGSAIPLAGGWRMEAVGREGFNPQVVGADPWQAQIDAGHIRGPLVLRSRRPGDRFQPLGLEGNKTLHEFMIDLKIPRHIRDLIPILSDDEGILWVCGYRLSERARVTPGAGEVIRIRFLK